MSSLRDRRSARTEALAAPPTRPADVVIGRLVRVGDEGAPLVDYPGNPVGRPVPALAPARYDGVPPDRSLSLMFLDGDPARPLAIGVIGPSDATVEKIDARGDERPGERLTLTAARELGLHCGRASLVLTRAGKVLVRGAYVSLRSSGVQRITGASVQIN